MSNQLTDESLLAQILGFLEVMLPLEKSESLVYQRKDVNPHRFALLLHLDCLVELLDGLSEVLLIKEQFTEVVVDIRNVLKGLHRPSEGGHGRCHGAHLVLRHTQLDVRVDEAAIEVDRLLVVLRGIGELAQDEVELGTVIVDIGIVLVMSNGKLEVIRCSVLVSCALSAATR